MADELELRRELDALARKRAALDAPSAPHRGNGASAASGGAVGSANGGGKKSVFARLGAGAGGSDDSPRGAARAVSKENTFDDNQQRGNKRGNNDRLAAATKRQRLHSAVSKPTDERNGRAEDPEDVSERKKRAVAPFTQKDTMARSRRMFGALMGHLGKAKAQIERDSDLFKRQDSKQHEVEKKEKIQSKTLEEKAKRDAAVQRLEKLIARTEVNLAEQLARLKLEHLQKTRKSASLSGFLQTVASPPIFYLPAKHTKETEDLVATSKEAHKEKLQISTREHEVRLREVDAEFTVKLEKLREELEKAKCEEATKNTKESSEATESTATVKNNTPGEADGGEQVSAGHGEVTMADAEQSGEMDESPDNNKEQADDDGDVKPSAMDDDDDITARSPNETLPDGTVQTFEERSAVDSENASPTLSMKEETAVSATAEESADGEIKTKERESEADIASETRDSKQETSASIEDAAAGEKNGVNVETPGAPIASEDPSENEEPKLEPSEPEAATAPEKQKIDMSALKVTELREELKKRGLDMKGLKAVLVARLEEAMADDAA